MDNTPIRFSLFSGGEEGQESEKTMRGLLRAGLRQGEFFELDGQEWVDITVTLKYSQVLDCINTDVLRASYAMDEVNNTEIKFHLYLDDNAKRWKVDNKIDLPLDPVKKFYTSLVSKQNRN